MELILPAIVCLLPSYTFQFPTEKGKLILVGAVVKLSQSWNVWMEHNVRSKLVDFGNAVLGGMKDPGSNLRSFIMGMTYQNGRNMMKEVPAVYMPSSLGKRSLTSLKSMVESL